MEQQRIEVLHDKYHGRPIAVLGGGPSLPDDLKALPDDTILIAVKDHAFRLVVPDYWVFNDKPEKRANLFETINKYPEIPRLSIWQNHSSFTYGRGATLWDGGFSSTTATWLACYMGGDPVILCGMDCYQGDMAYFYRAKMGRSVEHPVMYFPLVNHRSAWRGAFYHCPHSDRIKVASGPLVAIFGAYQNNTKVLARTGDNVNVWARTYQMARMTRNAETF